MKKTLSFIIVSVACLCLINISAQNMKENQKLRVAEMAISQFYVDTVNESALVESAIKGMLESLDPHSTYNTAEETRELNEPLEGNFSGIGITYNMTKDTLYVIQTVAGGPSERVGILAGDRIISVNDSSIAGQKLKTSQIMKKLRGPKGTKVDVKVLRKTGVTTDTIDFRITRDDIPLYSVDASYMIDGKTGYIRVSRFAAETSKEVREAIQKLRKEGMTQLILDLTDNGGGYLNSAVDVLGELLDPGSLAVYTEGRMSPRYDMKARPARGNPLFNNGRLVIMTNQFTASAAEIVSGAVQDWDRGVIVGRRTFGKGLVQRPFPFEDGSMMRLTIAHYYTPTGRDIQKPYSKGDAKSYNRDILDRLGNGELMHEDSIKYIDSLRVNTLRLNRPIYGGGGISPDSFVALDTTGFTKYYRDVVAKGAINQFVIEYVDKERKNLRKKYANDKVFADSFEITDVDIARLREIAKENGVEYNEEEEVISTPIFSMIMKALIGRDIYDNSTYYKVYNKYDPTFIKALEIINSEDYDKILTGQ